MTPEGKASQVVRVRASAWGLRLFRNQSGALPDRSGRLIRFGVGNESKKLNEELKSGDFIGVAPLVITPEMVGKTIGVFVNIEAKEPKFKIKNSYREGTREYAQDKFNKLVESLGAMAGFARNATDVDRIINNYINRIKQQ